MGGNSSCLGSKKPHQKNNNAHSEGAQVRSIPEPEVGNGYRNS